MTVFFDDMHDERSACVKMPELVGAQTMEGGKVFSFEQEVDGRRNQAGAGEYRRQSLLRNGEGGAIGLAIVPTFGVSDEAQFGDPVLGGLDHGRLLPY